MIKEQWRRIGIQADVKEMERSLFYTRARNNDHQIVIWQNDGSEMIFLFPDNALPVNPSGPLLGQPLAVWYATRGERGKAPTGAQLKAVELFRSAGGEKSPQERDQTARGIWKILVDEQFSIGLVGLSPAMMGVRIVSNKLGNIPARQVNAQHARTPCSSHPATFFFKA
jgi:peptide/nickel transport system substrate-binding protein